MIRASIGHCSKCSAAVNAENQRRQNQAEYYNKMDQASLEVVNRRTMKRKSNDTTPMMNGNVDKRVVSDSRSKLNTKSRNNETQHDDLLPGVKLFDSTLEEGSEMHEEVSNKRRRTANDDIEIDNDDDDFDVEIDSDDDDNFDGDYDYNESCFEKVEEVDEKEEDGKEVKGIQELKKQAHPGIRSVIHEFADKVFKSARNHNEVYDPVGYYSSRIRVFTKAHVLLVHFSRES